MSIFNELLPKLREISNAYTKNINDELMVAYECLEKFEEEYRSGQTRARDKAQKDKVGMTNLQSICEDDVDVRKDPETEQKSQASQSNSSTESNGERASKKRSKNEVEDMLSPEVDKRQKRNASVKAQSNISKQVNVNLTAKLRRENSNEKVEKTSSQSSKSRRRKNDEKENSEPNIPIQIKEEKISLPPEPMDMEIMNIPVKQENPDDIAMPPPAIPIPKPRKAITKEKSEDSSEEEPGKRRAPRTKKQAEPVLPPPVAATRATRSSARVQTAEAEEPPMEGRPKRTRKKKVSVSNSQNEVDSIQTSQESTSVTSSPAEKPRPKRTRRGKAAAKEDPKPVDPIKPPKEERISLPGSPILQKVKPKKGKNDITSTTIESILTVNSTVDKLEETRVLSKDLDKTRVIEKAVVNKEMDTTMVLTNGVYNHVPVIPATKNNNMNETVVIEKANRETIVVEKVPNNIMDATVVIEKGIKTSNSTEDNSLITDDDSEQEVRTPPRKDIKETQPSSAVKEKVQQFEEMASRVTRTKTRAMAKKEEQTDSHTPPDKIMTSKPVLSAETLNKMNSLIFNGKAPQISSSASKPKSAAPVGKSMIPSSTSKLSSISKQREAAEELKTSRTNEEDARKKKEAILEAKREQQRRKREEKMAAAALARTMAERERRLQLEQAALHKEEKQAHADKEKQERVKEAERKKQELARKVAETEERRKAEESARMQRLAEEQRKALAQRRKQREEQEATKKEELAMAKEIEKRNKEYLEKQKMKSRNEEKMHTPLRTPGTPGGSLHPLEPVYMADGFQYLYSDEDAEPPPRPVLEWCTTKARKQQLEIQSQISSVHIERLFSVRVHSPDLRDIFPNIERAHLKRTSSAVWRTPPAPLRTLLE